jgi:hypothetical protein
MSKSKPFLFWRQIMKNFVFALLGMAAGVIIGFVFANDICKRNQEANTQVIGLRPATETECLEAASRSRNVLL